MKRGLVVLALLLSGCAPPRFVERAPVWREPDDRPIARPSTHPDLYVWNGVRDLVVLPVDRALALDYGLEAVNVNSLDEVPESTWFHDPRRAEPDRTRPRELTSLEMAWGAASEDDVPVLPLFITKGKTVGATRGFVAQDTRGVRYMIKLDPAGHAGFATSVEVVVSRLAWACGWRVPPEVMIEVPAGALRIAPGATTKDEWGEEKVFGEAERAQLLKGVAISSDGRVKVLASRWLPGTPVGPYRYFGRRADDPNDRYPHEQRRDLRGLGVFSAWVNNTDTYEANTLDSYEGDDGLGHLVHYQQDLGGAFDAWGFGPKYYWISHETWFSPLRILRSLFSLGIAAGYWEDERFRREHDRLVATSPELAGFSDEHFEPRRWVPVVPNPAFSRQTARDRYWAAKRIALIGERELRAAISAGLYRSEVAERLFRILWNRRDRLLRAYLGDLSALDHFYLDGSRLCFEDLWLRAGLGGSARYGAREGKWWLVPRIEASGQGCVDLRPSSGYRVVTLFVRRVGQKASTPVRVHLVERGETRDLLGVER